MSAFLGFLFLLGVIIFAIFALAWLIASGLPAPTGADLDAMQRREAETWWGDDCGECRR